MWSYLLIATKPQWTILVNVISSSLFHSDHTQLLTFFLNKILLKFTISLWNICCRQCIWRINLDLYRLFNRCYWDVFGHIIAKYNSNIKLFVTLMCLSYLLNFLLLIYANLLLRCQHRVYFISMDLRIVVE